ncbi:hypothetical protein KBD59_01400 [Candidatus Gracilibacteria bacterium]|nr:hypothetical protein [Candidatus Gracilibacteria bacterium]
MAEVPENDDKLDASKVVSIDEWKNRRSKPQDDVAARVKRATSPLCDFETTEFEMSLFRYREIIRYQHEAIIAPIPYGHSSERGTDSEALESILDEYVAAAGEHPVYLDVFRTIEEETSFFSRLAYRIVATQVPAGPPGFTPAQLAFFKSIDVNRIGSPGLAIYSLLAAHHELYGDRGLLIYLMGFEFKEIAQDQFSDIIKQMAAFVREGNNLNTARSACDELIGLLLEIMDRNPAAETEVWEVVRAASDAIQFSAVDYVRQTVDHEKGRSTYMVEGNEFKRDFLPLIDAYDKQQTEFGWQLICQCVRDWTDAVRDNTVLVQIMVEQAAELASRRGFNKAQMKERFRELIFS